MWVFGGEPHSSPGTTFDYFLLPSFIKIKKKKGKKRNPSSSVELRWGRDGFISSKGVKEVV
jgi:hypothetical protein